MGHSRSNGSEFRTTRWTIVINAPHNPRDLETWLTMYREPICAYFVRKAGRDNAEDLTQAFICEVVLEGGFLTKADRTRGRFRCFLKTALSHFAIDKHYRKIVGRGGTLPRSINGCDAALEQHADEKSDREATDTFEAEYRRKILSEIRQELESRCIAEELEQHWAAYEARILRPVLHGCGAASVESIAAELGVSADSVSKMIWTVRRKSKLIAREVVGHTVDDPDEIDDEINSLWG